MKDRKGVDPEGGGGGKDLGGVERGEMIIRIYEKRIFSIGKKNKKKI